MSARALTLLPSWLLALLLGLGPVGADVLAALAHAQVCACCTTDEAESCCGAKEEESPAPEVVSAGGCPCALVAPSSEDAGAAVRSASSAQDGARARLERCHRAVELAWVQPRRPVTSSESSLAPPGAHAARASGPPGSGALHGPARSAALGVLRL